MVLDWLVDSGANVDARATMLVQWAVMGSIYMENVVGIKNPRVAIVNVGLEEEKGNSLLAKETYPMLKEWPNINFIGSIEAREIPNSYDRHHCMRCICWKLYLKALRR